MLSNPYRLYNHEVKKMEKQQNSRYDIQLAKAKDEVAALEKKIEKLSAVCDRKMKSMETCQKIMDSKAYPVLDPLMALLKKNFEESLQKKNKKVQKTKVKKSKAADKVVKVQHKIQRSKMLSNFFEALTTSDDKKSAFLVGMKAIHEDSTFRTNTKLNKLNQKLKAQKAKLENPNLSNEERQKISNKISKLQQKLSKLSDKLQRLEQLNQNLTEIAELPQEQVERLAQVTAEQVQTAIEDNANINKAVDEVAMNAAQTTNVVLKKEEPEQVKSEESKKSEPEQTEKTEQKSQNDDLKPQQIETQSEPQQTSKTSKEMKRKITQQQAMALIASGLTFNNIKVLKKTGELQVYFDKSLEQQMKAVLQTQTAKIKR